MTSTVTSHCNIVTSSSDSSGLYTSTVQSGPPLLIQQSGPTSPSSLLSPSVHSDSSPSAPSPPPLVPGCHSRLLLPLPLLTPLGFFNGMLAVSERGALNYYIFFGPILLTLSLFRNLISTHLPLSGSVDSLLCDWIAPTPGFAFSLVMPRTLAVTSSLLSGRANPSLNFLALFFLRSNSDVNISLNNSCSPSFLNVYAPPSHSLFFDGWQNRLLFCFHFSLLQKSLHSGGFQLPSFLLGFKRYFRIS